MAKPEVEKTAPLPTKFRFALIENLLQLLFPDRCLLCRSLLSPASVRPLCSKCDSSSLPIGPLCTCNCNPERDHFQPCGCLKPGYPLRSLFALAHYEGRWRNLLHDFKYRGRRSLARPLGRWLAEELRRQCYCRPQIIVPVPLHRNRERDRGFNQSALLARQVAQELQIPCSGLLIRSRETESQTKISRRERLLNVRGAFLCQAKIEPGTTVLLIDDIFSTGATMSEAAKCLQLSGALVYGAVVAFNPPR